MPWSSVRAFMMREKKHSDPKQAAWHGVNVVSTATTFGVLTTIAAFSPMLWIENELAEILAGFSAVVIFALIFSLIESKLILPSHLSFVSQKKNTCRTCLVVWRCVKFVSVDCSCFLKISLNLRSSSRLDIKPRL